MSRRLESEQEQAEAIHNRGNFSEWVDVRSTGVRAKYDFYRNNPAVVCAVRSKCDRACAKGLIISSPPVFDDAKKQERLVEFWKRDVCVNFLRQMYELGLTVGWSAWTIIPDKTFGARPVVVPPWTPGLQCQWNRFGVAKVRLFIRSGANGKLKGKALDGRQIFSHLLGAGLANTGSGDMWKSAGAISQFTMTAIARNGMGRTTMENSFSPEYMCPGFVFSHPRELHLFKMGTWDDVHGGVITPLDSLMEPVEFLNRIRRLWLLGFDYKVNKPVYFSDPNTPAKKSDFITDDDIAYASMPSCQNPDRLNIPTNKPNDPTADLKDEVRAQSAKVADLWAEVWNRTGGQVDPRAVLPPHLGGSTQQPAVKPSRERILRQGLVLQKGDNPTDLPDLPAIENHVGELTGRAYGVPVSLGSRSTDSGEAKLWSSGGDNIALKMLKESTGADIPALETLITEAWNASFSFNHAAKEGIRRLVEEKRKYDKLKIEELDAEGDSSMADAFGVDNDDDDILSKPEKELIAEQVAEEQKNSYPYSPADAVDEFENNVQIDLLGNIDMEDIQSAADSHMMDYPIYRELTAAHTGIPIRFFRKTLEGEGSFKLKMAEKEADIEANAKAKAKAKNSASSAGK